MSPAAPQSLRDLFASDITREIPPVVYFHEASPEKLATEVAEYIFTGGQNAGLPGKPHNPDGIHDQYVRLLTAVADELDRAEGPELPTAWISGFYGSGKSSFAKLLGYSLDGVELPDGRSLAEAWLRRNTTPRQQELRDAWARLRRKVEPLAVVFDVGAAARDGDQIHTAVLRQVQRKLGYSASQDQVAEHELALERDNLYPRFLELAHSVLGAPWSEFKDSALVEEHLSLVLHHLQPKLYPDPLDWFTKRAGAHLRDHSPEEVVKNIGDMLRFRAPRATVFVIVDEVYQYIAAHHDRSDRLRAFASALGRLKGKVWLFALGQQKVEEQSRSSDEAASTLHWLKDRFPQRLRFHLATTNIRDVVHKRLLAKHPDAVPTLRALFQSHRADLHLYGYQCEGIAEDEFVDFYPMLPAQMELVLRITSALRSRSNRAQGDDQAIRGLLQLLGELFRERRLADEPLGVLFSLDRVWEVQHTAFDGEIQASMHRVQLELARLSGKSTPETETLLLRIARTVALLQLLQETLPTTADLVARCLFDRLDRGNQLPQVTDGLDRLLRLNLLSYQESTGFRLQSSSGEEWATERNDIPVNRSDIVERVHQCLKTLVEGTEVARIGDRRFPYAAVFSDGGLRDEATLVEVRDEATLRLDFRFLRPEDASLERWLSRSAETHLRHRLVWVVGSSTQLEDRARDFCRSAAMVEKYDGRRASLSAARKLLFQQELNNVDDLRVALRDMVAQAFWSGNLYFSGRMLRPSDLGPDFSRALQAAGNRVLPEIFSEFVPTVITQSELAQLVKGELAGSSPKFLKKDLGILGEDLSTGGRLVATCEGRIPSSIAADIDSEKGLDGSLLLSRFTGPPWGLAPTVLKACLAGLLLAKRIRIQPEGGPAITAVRDSGTAEVFEKDRAFRRARFLPAKEDAVGRNGRMRICKLLETQLGLDHIDREDGAIADHVALAGPAWARELRELQTRMLRIPRPAARPADPFASLQLALEDCARNPRNTEATVAAVYRHLDVLADHLPRLRQWSAALDDRTLDALIEAGRLLQYEATQLADLPEGMPTNAQAATQRLTELLARDTPWVDPGELQQDIVELRTTYRQVRANLLGKQETEIELSRAVLRDHPAFATLSHSQTANLFQPLNRCMVSTSAEAVAPPLLALVEPFQKRLSTANQDAYAHLDRLHCANGAAPVHDLVTFLSVRDISTEAELDRALAELRQRAITLLQQGVRVRL